MITKIKNRLQDLFWLSIVTVFILLVNPLVPIALVLLGVI